MKSMDMEVQGFLGMGKLLEKSIGFVVHRFGVGKSGARFAVALDVDWKSQPIVLHMDLMKGLHLTKMTCKRMVMQVLENSGRLLEFRT